MKIFKTEIQPILAAGDCILVDSNSFISDGIEWFENGKVSHVAVYIGNNEIVEATETGVKRNKVNKYYSKKYNWCVRRIKGLTADQSQKIVTSALSLVGKPYDFLQFIGLAIFYLVKKLTGKKYYWLIGQSGDDMMICSEVFVKATRDAGIELFGGIDAKSITPQDLLENNNLVTIKELKIS